MQDAIDTQEWHNWFALQVKPRHEQSSAKALRQKGYDEFVPLYRCRRRWSDRVKEIDLPLFPGYIFCRLDNQNIRLPVVTTPGVHRILGQVRRQEMTTLLQVIRSGQHLEPWPYLTAGSRVQIIDGPLAGVHGCCSR